MKAISNALKGVTYHNPQWGESLYELCRRATSRHIDRPDEIINQQVVYMINSEMHAPFAAKDACTCLKRRLQMDHPQKQYLAIILTSKVLQECHAALGPYQGELLQEVAYILRTVRSSSPAAARTRQVAMDVLRHFGSAGGDAYRVARQQGGVAPVGGARQDNVNRDPAAVAAERASLLDEIKRMVEQASASTEILNELILNKEQPGGAAGASAASESVGLRKELLADVAELRKLFDLYMGQLAGLSGPDAEAAMKAALEAVDQLDGALSLEKDVDAELKDLASKGQLPPSPAAAADSEAAAAAGGASSSAAATAAAVDEAAARVQSVNLIDLDDEPTPAAAAAAPTAAAAAGPFDPFAPPVMAAAPGAAAAAALDPFAPAPAAAIPDPFQSTAVAAPDHADPFAALAAAPLTSTPAAQPQQQPFPEPFPQPAAQQPFAQPAAAAADPFAEPGPAWGSSAAAAAAAQPFPGSLPQQQLLQQQQQQQSGGGVSAGAVSGGGVGSLPTSGGGSSSAGPTGGGAPPGGFMAGPPAAAAAGQYGGAPVTPGYGGGFMPAPGPQGLMGTPYGYGMQPMQQQMPGPYGMPNPYAGMTGAMYMPQPTGGPSPYGQPMMPPATAAYPGVPAPYPSPYPQQPQQQQQMPMPPQQQQQQPGAFGGLPAVSAPAAGAGGAADQAVLSPTNPFASVAPAPVVGGVANPFQSPAGSAGGAAAANVEQEWNTFFSDRPGVAAAK